MDHLTDKEFDRVCTHLSRTFGLNMRSKRVLLDCRLSRERERLGFSSFSAYLDKVEAETDPEATARFVDLVTTHYTYFLRERRQFDFLRTTAFPELGVQSQTAPGTSCAPAAPPAKSATPHP